MTQLPPKSAPQTLATWLGRAPLKFALCALFLPIALIILYAVIGSAVAGTGVFIPAWPVFIIGVMGWAIPIYKLIKDLRTDRLDRRSFVAISTGGFIVARLMGLVILCLFGFLFFPFMAAFSNPMAHVGFSFGMMIVLLLLGLMGAYAAGILISRIYATYLRAIDMGVSRPKALLSLPYSMHWMPGYFLDGARRRPKNEIPIRASGFRALVDWIIATPANTWLTLIIMVILGGILYGFGWLTVFAIPPVIFIVWMLVTGADNMRKNINGAWANVAIVVNIMTIVAILTTGIWTRHILNTQADMAIITQEVIDGE